MRSRAQDRLSFVSVEEIAQVLTEGGELAGD